MLKILTINEIDLVQWNELLKSSPTSSFFQSKECFDFYNSLNCLEPIFYAVSEYEKLVGVVCGYLVANGGKIKRFMSRRAIIPGGALLAKSISNEALDLLLNAIIQSLKHKVIYIEFRNYNNFSQYKNIFEKMGFAYNKWLDIHIKIANLEEVMTKISPSKRKNIRSSLKHGAEIIEIVDDNDIIEFYKIISELYKNKIKTPLFDYEFFEKFVKLQNAKLLGIKYNSMLIGGVGCVFLQNGAVYEWFKCGIDSISKQIYPSTLATYAGIQFAIKNNAEYYDMMGAGKPDEQSGVRDFKCKLGGKLADYGRFLYIGNSVLYNLGKFYINNISRF
jgi:lipid II:glycine glycyltransferase (peptidoglycan interpeptide bridge formation enzyme)